MTRALEVWGGSLRSSQRPPVRILGLLEASILEAGIKKASRLNAGTPFEASSMADFVVLERLIVLNGLRNS